MEKITLLKKCPAMLCVVLLALAAVFGMTFAAWGAGSTDATGFLEKNGVWYYYDENGGTVEQDIVQDPSGKVYNTGRDTWWYVEDSVVRTDFTGVEKNSYGWWYVKDGAVDFSHNGVECNDYGWWYIVSGKVDFSYTGVANYSNDYGWWYIKDGKVDFTCNSVEQNVYGWWYVIGGKVDFSYTGVANYSNDYGWWYIKEGKVDFGCNSVEKNDYGWWYVTGGKVQFGYTGVANYSNDYGWWYIKDGKVDFSKNSVENNTYGWWYVKKGEVDFSYNGIAKNDYGWWYINDGQVNFSHSVDVDYDMADKVLELVNKERAQNGCSSVSETEKASEAAITRAGELSFNFSHVRPDGSSWDTVLIDYNISYSSAGENAALGQNSTDELWEDWMDSPGHKSNILNSNYTNVGIGCVKIDGIYYWDMLLYT